VTSALEERITFGWLKKILGMADRTEKAADRIAETMEGIADDRRLVRKALRQRIGLEDDTAEPALPAVAASLDVIDYRSTDTADAPANCNGRRAKAKKS
jgi:hypothetical protein